MKEVYSLRIKKTKMVSKSKYESTTILFTWDSMDDALACKDLLSKAEYMDSVANRVELEFVRRAIEEKL